MSFEEGLKRFAKDLQSKIDKSIKELLYGHYPDLTEKEFAICEIIAAAIWDISMPFYDAIVSNATEYYKGLFHNTDEVETVAKQLVSEGIVRDHITFLKWYFPPIMRCKECLFRPSARNCQGYLMWPTRFLDLKREIEDEAFEIYSTHFGSSSTEYFGPVKPEDPS
jgi:hypothetical protein